MIIPFILYFTDVEECKDKNIKDREKQRSAELSTMNVLMRQLTTVTHEESHKIRQISHSWGCILK